MNESQRPNPHPDDASADAAARPDEALSHDTSDAAPHDGSEPSPTADAQHQPDNRQPSYELFSAIADEPSHADASADARDDGKPPEPLGAAWTESGSGVATKPPRRIKPDDEDDSIAPKGLILAWCLYLLGNGVVAWYLDSGGREREFILYLDLTPPAVRWMLMSGAVGMMTLWPVLRLSSFTHRRRSKSCFEDAEHPQVGPMMVLLDWAALNAIFQIAIFLLWLHPQWVQVQSLWVNLAVLAWSLLVGLIIAAGRLSDRGVVRTVAMLLCVLLLVGEPAVMMLVNLGRVDDPVTWPMRVSPLHALWAMTEPNPDWRSGPWPGIVLSVAAASAIGWVLLLLHQTRRALLDSADKQHVPG